MINLLHSFKRQPFWFQNLNSMVPVKGDGFVQFSFFESSLFFYSYCFCKKKILQLIFFVDFKPLMKPKSESA